MKEKYTPLLLSTGGKVAVLLATASLLAAGIYGSSKVKRPKGTPATISTESYYVVLLDLGLLEGVEMDSGVSQLCRIFAAITINSGKLVFRAAQ